ncbi:hypothetical protein [Thauera humireducens]|uniref:hypothetical protein n=1 Tax=Thauera humireducens TaxID=1134435 RepID=UPI00311F898F
MFVSRRNRQRQQDFVLDQREQIEFSFDLDRVDLVVLEFLVRIGCPTRTGCNTVSTASTQSRPPRQRWQRRLSVPARLSFRRGRTDRTPHLLTVEPSTDQLIAPRY